MATTIILLFIPRELLFGINFYRDIIGCSLSNKPISFSAKGGKEAFQLTVEPWPMAEKSILERARSSLVVADAAARTFWRALRVARRQFVYTILVNK